MPLLNKDEFERSPPPDNLKPDDTVFYNKLTNEVFTDYDEYFARVILCNSLVWTCSLTGKSGLTFQDALESEEAAREWLRVFPDVLRRPILYLTDLTSRGRFADLVDDVFNVIKDRFVVGEQIDYVYNGKRKGGKVIRIHPFAAVAKEHKVDNSTTGKSKKKDSSDLLRVLYDIEDDDTKETFEVSGKDLFRPKRTFTRDRLKVFLKVATELRGNVHRVKLPIAEKYKLGEVKFHELTIGQLPEFVVTPTKRVSKAMPAVKKADKVKDEKQPKEKPNKESNKENKAESAKTQKKPKKKPDEKADKENPSKKKKSAAKKEADELLVRTMFTMWMKPRDDLTLDGLRDLPLATSFDCKIPQEGLSDALVVLEFLAAFTQELRVKDYFSSGVTFDLLERAVTETDIIGPLGDIFQILLTNLFKLKEEENNFEYAALTPSDDQPEAVYNAQKSAGRTLRRIHRVLGFSLPQLTLDKFTLSEVLRLHIESSGAPGITKKVGNMDSAEDPGLAFFIEHPEIIEVLRTASLFELGVVEKLKLLRLIVEQLLCTDGIRDMMEEARDAHKAARVELRKLRINARPGPGPDGRAQISPREFERREEELKQRLKSAKEKIMLVPLGEDRAYRRYYLANSIPAVIIEDDAAHIGDECIAGGTPKHKMTSFSPAFMKQFVQNCDKENASLSLLTPSVKAPTNDNPEEVHVKEEHSSLTCTGDRNSCFVHNRSLVRNTWRFVSSREQLDEIIAALDNRGVREKLLKDSLNANLANLRLAIDKTPSYVLNRNFENTRRTKLPSQLIRDSLLYGVNPSFALELSFREILLGLEERLSAGNLGHLKEDRQLWRGKMVQILDHVGNQKTAEQINALQIKKDMSEVIAELSAALISVGHSVEEKVLMAPLGRAEPTSKSKKKKDSVALTSGIMANWLQDIRPDEATANGDSKTTRATGPDEGSASDSDGSDARSHDQSTPDDVDDGSRHMNLSRLFLLMYSLERSVMWTRSITNAACLVCRKKSNPDQMLLCDGCDRGYHLYCLKPPLSDVPQGDWFCLQCAPIPLSPRKRTRAPVDVSSEDDEEEDEDDENDEEQEGESEVDENQDVCHECEIGGELILCDFCPRAYHLECCQLKRVPRGTFKCPVCVKGDSRKSKTRRSPPATKVKVQGSKSARRVVDMGVVEDVESFDYNVCSNLLKQLVRSDDAWPFLASVTRKDAPDYHKVIKRPMDFGTLQGKLNDMKYKNNAAFISDVLQIFVNCCVYNKPRSDVVKAATSLSAAFCEMLVQVGLECYVELKDSILEETEESSGWSQGKPRGNSTSKANGVAGGGDMAESETMDDENPESGDEQEDEDEDGAENETGEVVGGGGDGDDDDDVDDDDRAGGDDDDDDDAKDDASEEQSDEDSAQERTVVSKVTRKADQSSSSRRRRVKEKEDDGEDDDDDDDDSEVESDDGDNPDNDDAGSDDDDDDENYDEEADRSYGSRRSSRATVADASKKKKNSNSQALVSSPRRTERRAASAAAVAVRVAGHKRKRGGGVNGFNDDDDEDVGSSSNGDEDFMPKRRASTRRGGSH